MVVVVVVMREVEEKSTGVAGGCLCSAVVKQLGVGCAGAGVPACSMRHATEVGVRSGVQQRDLLKCSRWSLELEALDTWWQVLEGYQAGAGART